MTYVACSPRTYIICALDIYMPYKKVWNIINVPHVIICVLVIYVLKGDDTCDSK
jgi:hypothetical protein